MIFVSQKVGFLLTQYKSRLPFYRNNSVSNHLKNFISCYRNFDGNSSIRYFFSSFRTFVTHLLNEAELLLKLLLSSKGSFFSITSPVVPLTLQDLLMSEIWTMIFLAYIWAFLQIFPNIHLVLETGKDPGLKNAAGKPSFF